MKYIIALNKYRESKSYNQSDFFESIFNSFYSFNLAISLTLVEIIS